jgi:diguanylate cyclase (GGDEF)-like protein
MKRSIPAFAALLGWALAAWAASPSPLTDLRAIAALGNTEASHHPPVAFEATVTYFPGYESLLFVQDGDAAVFVLAPTDVRLVAGDRVLVRGTMRESFRPIVIPDSVTVLRHGTLPKAMPATFDELIRSMYDCRLVTVRAVIRTADLRVSSYARTTYMQMATDGGYIDATVDSDDEKALKGLLDAEVEVTGIAGGKFDGKMQLTGVLLHVPTLADVKILKRAGASPWSLPVTPMDKILSAYHVQEQMQRVRVHGTITYFQPDSSAVLQDGAKSLWIGTPVHSPLQIGDLADATGFPDTRNGSLILSHGEIQDSHVQAPITPQAATWRQLAFWSANSPDGHLYDLVSIEGQVVTEVREASQDEYVLIADGKVFSAIFRHEEEGDQLQLPPMKKVSVGSKIRVTGICMIDATNPFNTTKEAPFSILLRSFNDITVVDQPSLINTRNLLLALGVLLIVVFVVIARGWALERKVRRQTAMMSARTEAEAELERQRSRILEDINESRPLAEILVQIAAMVSSALKGAPCWCEVADGERLGDCPEEQQSLRIVRATIDARVGPALGALFAGLDPKTPPIDREIVALHNGARLATLAIETRRLYADLRRRSEYDLLTDIPNRFAIEKFIELQIEEARQSGRILALIYIDLDKFKLVNDTYGHHVGDLYLQEAALRMSHQLLGRDMLARLGGDEFGALVSLHHGVNDLDKIVARLEHCFDRPFAVGGYLLNGSASFGTALYPQDGATKDSLLSAADAAMYAAKNRKRAMEETPAQARIGKSQPGVAPDSSSI